MRRRLPGTLAVLVLALSWPSGQARADAIDGTWCSKDGRNMIIEGPSITTPGGTNMTGDYDRHAFEYVIPEKETHAGAKVSMVLINDNTIHLQVGTEDSPLEVWRRCDLTAWSRPPRRLV